jgi:hypothetical protein
MIRVKTCYPASLPPTMKLNPRIIRPGTTKISELYHLSVKQVKFFPGRILALELYTPPLTTKPFMISPLIMTWKTTWELKMIPGELTRVSAQQKMTGSTTSSTLSVALTNLSTQVILPFATGQPITEHYGNSVTL